MSGVPQGLHQPHVLSQHLDPHRADSNSIQTPPIVAPCHPVPEVDLPETGPGGDKIPTLPTGVVFAGNGMLRWDGFNEVDASIRAKPLGYRTIERGLAELVADQNAVGVDFARCSAGEYSTFLHYSIGHPVYAVPVPGIISFRKASAAQVATPPDAVERFVDSALCRPFRHDPYTDTSGTHGGWAADVITPDEPPPLIPAGGELPPIELGCDDSQASPCSSPANGNRPAESNQHNSTALSSSEEGADGADASKTGKRSRKRGPRRRETQARHRERRRLARVAGRKVFFGQLPRSITDAAFWSLASQCGEVAEVMLLRDKATNVATGAGFVTYKEGDSAAAAIERFNEQVCVPPMRQPLRVRWADPPREKDVARSCVGAQPRCRPPPTHVRKASERKSDHDGGRCHDSIKQDKKGVRA